MISAFITFLFSIIGDRRPALAIYHPHYQIIAIPVIPPDVSHSLDGSLRYYKKYKKCVHCVMMDYEKKNKKRIYMKMSEPSLLLLMFQRTF